MTPTNLLPSFNDHLDNVTRETASLVNPTNYNSVVFEDVQEMPSNRQGDTQAATVHEIIETEGETAEFIGMTATPASYGDSPPEPLHEESKSFAKQP